MMRNPNLQTNTNYNLINTVNPATPVSSSQGTNHSLILDFMRDIKWNKITASFTSSATVTPRLLNTTPNHWPQIPNQIRMSYLNITITATGKVQHTRWYIHPRNPLQYSCCLPPKVRLRWSSWAPLTVPIPRSRWSRIRSCRRRDRRICIWRRNACRISCRRSTLNTRRKRTGLWRFDRTSTGSTTHRATPMN